MELFDIVLVGILVVLAILVALFAFDVLGTRQTRKKRQSIRAELDDIDAQLSRIAARAGSYSPGDAPPYGPLSAKLNAAIDAVRSQTREQRPRTKVSAQPPSVAAETIPAYIWLATLPGFHHHRNNHKVLDEVRATVNTLRQEVSVAQGLLAELDDLPRLIVVRYHELSSEISRCSETIRQLQTARVFGPELFQVMGKIKSYTQAVADFPQDVVKCYPRNGTSPMPCKSSVITAWQMLEVLEPEVKDTLLQVDGWRQTQQTLFELIRQNSMNLDQIDSTMQAASALPRYPVKWVGGEESLRRLRKQQKDIGVTDARRPPEILGEALAAAQTLSAGVKTLSEWVTSIQQARQVIVKIIDHLQIVDVAKTNQRAQNLATTITTYHPSEWDKQDQVHTLKKDAAQLFQECNQFVADFSSGQLIDRALSQFAINTGLEKRVADFQARLEQIETRLNTIDQAARQNRETIESTLLALKDILAEIARLGKQRDVGRAVREGENALKQLQNEGRNLRKKTEGAYSETVDKLTKKVEVWAGSCGKTLSKLSETLHQEITDGQDQLIDQIKTVKKRACLDRDSAMRQAEQQRKILDNYKVPRHQPAASISLEALSGRILTQLKHRDNLQAALVFFESEIGDSLFSLFEQTKAKARQSEKAIEPLQGIKNSVDFQVRNEIEKAEKLIRRADKDVADLAKIGHTMADVRFHLRQSEQKYDQAIDRVGKISKSPV